MTDRTFQGFGTPEENWSKLPHTLIAALSLIETVSELKVILYILRHTWGYHETEKRISLDEFANGRKRRGGERLDDGTGLSIPSIRNGIKRAIDHGFVSVEVDDSDKARVKKFYSLNQSVKLLHPDCKSFTPRVKESFNRTKKETSERNEERHGADAPKQSLEEKVGDELLNEYIEPRQEKEPAPITPHWTELIKEDWAHWALWGTDSDEMQHQLAAFGERGRAIQRLGYELDHQFALHPLWDKKRDVKSWMGGLAVCLNLAEGDEKIVIRAARTLIEDGMTVSDPWSLQKKTRALAAEKARGSVPSGLDAPSPVPMR